VRMHHNPCVPGSKPSEDPSLLLHLTRYRTYGRFAVFPMHARCNTRRRVSEVQDTKRTKNTSSCDSGAIELAILRREFVSPISPLRKNTWFNIYTGKSTNSRVRSCLKTIRPKGQDTRHPRGSDGGWVSPALQRGETVQVIRKGLPTGLGGRAIPPGNTGYRGVTDESGYRWG